MLDLDHLGQYRENNRIEAKTALGGLPESIWETYSSFANTLGGIILLGVREAADKSFQPVDLPAPEEMAAEFWQKVNDPAVVNVNILTKDDILLEEAGGRHIIAVTVPRASRFDRPVLADGTAYRRRGEGDYRCTEEEVRAMRRDAAPEPRDREPVLFLGEDAFCRDTVHRYRERFRKMRPGHRLTALPDRAFLREIGALAGEGEAPLHPTEAGLLLFGFEPDIVRRFPRYFLDYGEEETGFRLISTSGRWSGNVFDFYFSVLRRLTSGSPAAAGGLAEALVNCLVHADYSGETGLTVRRKKEAVTLENPGAFRVDPGAARRGGQSDPRNGGMQRIFSLIGAGRGEGGGFAELCSAWEQAGLPAPQITERFQPERITLSLRFGRGKPVRVIRTARREAILRYLTERVSATSRELAAFLRVGSGRVRQLLAQLTEEGIVVSEGRGREKRYRLKS